MNITTIHPATFLYHREEISIDKLITILERGIAAQLQKEAVNHKMLIAGPVIWHYDGFTGNPGETFMLDVAIPVQEVPEAYKGNFLLKHTPVFHCISLIHYGSWESIPVTYMKLSEMAATGNMTFTGSNRELYINADFRNPEANITLVQMGIRVE